MKTRWIGAQLFIDNLFAGLRNETTPIDDHTENNPCQSDVTQLIDEMTNEELAACAVLCHVNKCCLALLDTNSPPRIPLSQTLEDTNQSLKALLQEYTEARRTANDDFADLKPEVIVPYGLHLHGAFCALEASKCVITYLDTFVANNKTFKHSLSKEQATSLRKSVDELYQFIRTESLAIKNNLSKSGTVRELVDILRGPEEGETDRISKEVSSLIEKPWTERFCVDLIESWQDAIDGVLQVKIGLP